MKKRILLVHTGGTIGSAFDKEKQCRVLAPGVADMTLLKRFMADTNATREEIESLFGDSGLDEKNRTFSENMTYHKLDMILRNISTKNIDDYSGIIILHGTDTLAYTSSLFSFVFSDTDIPIMMVSGNRPPDDEKSNANINFQTAVRLILEGIAPNVYVPYRNADGKMWLHIGSAIRQSPNYSEDFECVSEKKSFCLNNVDLSEVFSKCLELSDNRKKLPFELNDSELIDNGVLMILPYTGMDYAHYNLDGVKAIIHGSYHSGTVCVERNSEADEYNSNSLLWLADECDRRKIPIFVAPSKLTTDQYSSVLDLVKNSSAKLLDMTTESAYAKLLLAISCGYENLSEYMYMEISNEIIG